MNQRLIKIMAGTAAAVAIALGGVAIGRTGSGSSSAATPNGVFQPGGGIPGGGREGGFQGGPPNGAPGFGTAVTGDAAAKVKAAVDKKYPGAQIERIFALPDGSYVAHVFPSSGQEVHLHLTKAFAIDGSADGGPPNGTTPPPGSQTS